ncbi:hypothetical protein [Ochrobactrum sp. CGA5]|nr:hypothetical protein [Ochrobactrum sp. CGA5]
MLDEIFQTFQDVAVSRRTSSPCANGPAFERIPKIVKRFLDKMRLKTNG